MYYLGIDPGVRKLWFALIDSNHVIKKVGILLQDEKKVDREVNYTRMDNIYEFFDALLEEYKGEITAAGIEKLFFTQKNQANAEFVYGIRGALILLLRRHNIKILDLSPTELKKITTGNGKANKILVQQMIRGIFHLEWMPEYDDAADALWLAYVASKVNTSMRTILSSLAT